jgi:hypothetical protein
VTKYISTMTEEEIAAWMRAPGAAAAAGKVGLASAPPRPKPAGPRRPPPPRPAIGGPMPPGPSVLEEPNPGLVLPAAAPSHIPETAKNPETPCRFCGEPSTVEDRCARHDALWQRLSGKQAADLQRIAGG